MELSHVFVTGAAAVLLALAFLVGDRVHLLRSVGCDPRTVTSFGAGIAVAYVFVQVVPELHSARRSFTSAASATLPFDGMVVYFVALVGFLVFYGLDHLRQRVRPGDSASARAAFRLHIGGFAAYVWLVSGQLVAYPREAHTSLALFAVAMAMHFVGVDHLLRQDHGERYDRVGKFVLASASAAGWVAGLLLSIPPGLLALSVAFVSGAVIVNSSIMELPSESDGRFVPFLCGGLIYGLVLLPLG